MELSEPAAGDPFRGRQPTSYERMTGLPWDASYVDGLAPWDVGPQPAVVRLAARGCITGPVLDAGYGTGENALHLGPSGSRCWASTWRRRPSRWPGRKPANGSLASVTEPGATLYVLCFSDEGLDEGPHPVSRDELATAFGPGSGWTLAAVEPDRVQTRFHDDDGASAWLASITRS